MTLSINNGGYAFLIRFYLMFFMSLWKKFKSLQVLKDLYIKHFIKLIIFENDVKRLKFTRSLVQVESWYVSNVRLWLLIDLVKK